VLPGQAERALSFQPIGPLSVAETMKLAWALPAVDELTEAELEQVWRMVGGHPRCLEYLDALLSAVRTNRAKILFLANPDNPTGELIAASDLKALVSQLPESCLLLLDEAYVEFARDEEVLEVGFRPPNLVRLRTFSKAYGLAGLRIGYGLGDPTVCAMLNRVRQPFNVNSVAQAAALAALADVEYVAESAQINHAGLDQLTCGLAAMGVAYVPSHANFLLVHVGAAGAIYDALLRQGVIVRPVANYGLPEHLRVSVGLPAENQRFLDALKVALAR